MNRWAVEIGFLKHGKEALSRQYANKGAPKADKPALTARTTMIPLDGATEFSSKWLLIEALALGC
jgi:hypothetical protein